MVTKRLFDEDAYMSSFSAVVVSCEKNGNMYDLVLDRTAFFPEGGGQAYDEGLINGEKVFGVFEKNGVIFHRIEKRFDIGERVDCQIDFVERFRRMQNHSGEHLMSGIAHRVFGAENVGFHLSEKYIRVDYDRFFTNDEIECLERMTNEGIWKNLKINCFYPNEDEIKKIEYRSKKEIDGAIRLVEIENADMCACCAPHVKRTGEIGIVKICDHIKYKGGCRIEAVCGTDAYEMYAKEHYVLTEIARGACTKRDEISAYVERLKEEINLTKQRLSNAENKLMHLYLEMTPHTNANICFFFENVETATLRDFVNEGINKCDGIFAVFCGDDKSGYKFIAGSEKIKLKDKCKIMSERLSAKCGGSDKMIQGSACAKKEEISEFFNEFLF